MTIENKNSWISAYLAGPYTCSPKHDLAKLWNRHSSEVQMSYADLHAAVCAHLLVKYPNITTFSPITHGHACSLHMTKEQVEDHDFWMKHSLRFLLTSDVLFVLPLVGYRQSKGLQIELNVARSLGIPIVILLLDDWAKEQPWWEKDLLMTCMISRDAAVAQSHLWAANQHMPAILPIDALTEEVLKNA